MKPLLKNVIKAVNTIFFQEGFDRRLSEHKNLEYWAEKGNRGVYFYDCEDTMINNDDCCRRYLLKTAMVDDQWYLNIYRGYTNDYDDWDYSMILCVPIDPNRLCWEEAPKCVDLIMHVINNV